MARLLSSASEVLESDGLLLMEERDRRYIIFLIQGCARALAEGLSGDRLVPSFHLGYDVRRGAFRGLRCAAPEGRAVAEDFYLWGLAGHMASAWLFFGDVDFLPLERSYSGFILARGPRRRLRPPDLSEEPRVLKA